MKFLVDAQLPRRIVHLFRSNGHDALHTLDLPLGNRTPDAAINDLSLMDQRIVITKDADFIASFFLQGKPYKLLLVSTGNIRNAELEDIFLRNLRHFSEAFINHSFLELERTRLIVHV